MPRPSRWRHGGIPGSISTGGGHGIDRKEAGFLHLEIEIEVHLRLFENLFLQAIVFRLLWTVELAVGVEARTRLVFALRIDNVLLFEDTVRSVNYARRLIAVPFEVGFEAEHCLVRGLHRRPVERRNPLARGSLQLVRELPGIVGDQLGPVPGPADRHVEGSLVGKVRVSRGHGRYDLVYRPALKSVHRGGESPVEVT